MADNAELQIESPLTYTAVSYGCSVPIIIGTLHPKGRSSWEADSVTYRRTLYERVFRVAI